MFRRKKEKAEIMDTTEIAAQEDTGIKKEKIPMTKEQKKKLRKRIIIGGIVVVLAGIVSSKLFAPEVLPTVSVVTADIGEVRQIVEGSGTVKSEKIRTYFSPVSATIEQFDLSVGDMVEEGETLLTYDAKELNQLYKQADLTGSVANYGYQDTMTKNSKNESEYARSSDVVNVLKNSIENEKDVTENVQDQIVEYTAKQAEVQQQISEEQIKVSDAERIINVAQGIINSMKGEGDTDSVEKNSEDKNANVSPTATDGTGTEEDPNKIIEEQKEIIEKQTKIRDAALAEIKELQKELNSINEKLNSYEDRLKDSSEELERLQNWKAKEEGIKESSDAAILSEEAKKQLAADNSLSNLNVLMTKEDINAGKKGIQAEFSGVVTEVTAVAGGPAAKGGSLFSIASNENVVVDMSVTRYDLEKLEVGQSAEITLAGRKYTGTVSKLSRLAEVNAKGTPVVSAEIHIDGADENIYLGLEAKVKVNGYKAENVLTVPVETVNTGKSGSFCYVVENGVVVKKDVETGLSSATMIEIKSGLKEGDQVIKVGTELLEEGMKVTAVEE